MIQASAGEVVPVGGVVPQKCAYLTLDELTADPALARRLPSDLAWRCHALPLAEDNGRITVAMADPDDAEAREAIVAALGPRSCVVRGSPLAIDARLAEIWGLDGPSQPRLEVYVHQEGNHSEIWDYARSLGALLGACVELASPEAAGGDEARDSGHSRCDLMLFSDRNHPLLGRLLSREARDRDPVSQRNRPSLGMLVARRPRWPLQRILLTICAESADDAALDWAVRLARPSGAAVTALAVVPPVPAMYRGLSRMELSVAALLATDTALGRQIHHVARRLAEGQVDGTVRLRQGAPDHQICREALEQNHDLVIMATRPCRWLWRQLRGDPICSLLGRLDRPVLLVEPTTE